MYIELLQSVMFRHIEGNTYLLSTMPAFAHRASMRPYLSQTSWNIRA
jgi:hypothetical protein